MGRSALAVLLAAAIALWAVSGLAADGRAAAATLTGEVVAVLDGDTITVLDAERTQHRVRLAGIDSPETGQPYGHRARQALAQAVFRRQVVVGWSKRDRYGRIVGKVLQGGRDVCLAQVTEGFAWHYEQYARDQPPADRDSYRQAQVAARAASRGLWQDPAPVAPWDYRRARADSRARAAPAR